MKAHLNTGFIKMNEEIAKILNDNLGNRLTVELANGLYSAIMTSIDKSKPEEIKKK